MIKKTLLLICLMICLVASSFSQDKEFPKLIGPYLEQKPPGMAPVIFAPGIVSSGSHDLSITISPDLKEIYITRSGPDWFSAILVFKQTESGWTEPEILKLPGVFEGHYPFVSPDGKHLYFNASQQTTKETKKTDRIWIADRYGSEISNWRMMDLTANSDGNAMFPSVAANATVYFSSIRAGGLGRFDIYKSVLGKNGRSQPENLGSAINSEDNEFHAYIAPDESYIIFDSSRAGGYGRNDLYISYRNQDGGWTTALNMGPSINTESGEQRPFVSPDGKYLFFCSDRPNPQVRATDKPLTYEEFVKRTGGPGNGSQDIYWVDAKIIEDLRPKK
jgi:Tol biopolymer transport system component